MGSSQADDITLYFDHAATTPMLAEVRASWIEASEMFGNPSSLHQYGRKAKAAIELIRRQIAQDLAILPSEVFFTSGATESLNTAIRSAVLQNPHSRIYCSPIEHHAVLDSAESLAKEHQREIIWLPVDENGIVNFTSLEDSRPGDVLLAMGHNNEIGIRNPLERLSEVAVAKELIWITDTVQTLCIERLRLDQLKGITAIAASAHKFGGPKGVGFLVWRGAFPLRPLMVGGAQERALRAGTENTASIVAMGKAWQILQANLSTRRARMLELAELFKEQLQTIPNLAFNSPLSIADHHPGIINVSVPYQGKTAMLLFNLDMRGLCISEGSACTSGSSQGSHVIKALGKSQKGTAHLRFSLGHENTKEDILLAMSKLQAGLAVS